MKAARLRAVEPAPSIDVEMEDFVRRRDVLVERLQTEHKALRERLDKIEYVLRSMGWRPTTESRPIVYHSGRPKNTGATGAALRFLEENPGATAAEIHKATGIAKAVVGRMKNDGRLHREHRNGAYRYYVTTPPIGGDTK